MSNHLTRRRMLAAATMAAAFPPSRTTVTAAADAASAILQQSVDSGTVTAAALCLQRGAHRQCRHFGTARSENASFLLGSISKPIALTALMTLFDQQRFQLDDRVSRYLPEFSNAGRDHVTIRHLLTHVSGLPDQLPNNNQLRAAHAGLSDFTAAALRVPLSFPPGSRYQYSSMGILLAAEIAQRLTGTDIRSLVQQTVLTPLSMHNSALGTGHLQPTQLMPCQTEFAAPEAGAGAADAKNWDWNSPFWRQLGAPWGGLHASAIDVGRWLYDFLQPSGKVLRSETAALMTRNHNPPELESRGLAFDVGLDAVCRGCSSRTFGHTGSTGTIALADPETQTVCVVLTTLPGPAVPGPQHPRLLAAEAALQMLR
ncbi:MAG: serine hydrolase domain-containing protein [Planctomycetota bacterium]